MFPPPLRPLMEERGVPNLPPSPILQARPIPRPGLLLPHRHRDHHLRRRPHRQTHPITRFSIRRNQTLDPHPLRPPTRHPPPQDRRGPLPLPSQETLRGPRRRRFGVPLHQALAPPSFLRKKRRLLLRLPLRRPLRRPPPRPLRALRPRRLLRRPRHLPQLPWPLRLRAAQTQIRRR
ncbi:hypothetical protein AAZV13_06G143650 [Glycine max]